MTISILLIIFGFIFLLIGILKIVNNVKYEGTIIDEENALPFCLSVFGLTIIIIGIIIIFREVL